MCICESIHRPHNVQAALQGKNPTTYLDSLHIKRQALLLVHQKVLDHLALVALELDDLAHFRVDYNGAIARCTRRVSTSIRQPLLPNRLPNCFLMTFRIFFWSNFLGRPCTVVRVLRPLRSARVLASTTAMREGQPIFDTYAGCGCGCSSETD